MNSIDVRCEATASGWTCAVTVTGDHGATRHQVEVSREELDRLAPGATEPTDLVQRSFTFLLEREPKESILRTFDLSMIGGYFPEYEAAIRRAR